MIGSDPRYQTIIDQYRTGAYNAPYQSMDYTPSPYYNPIYDIRSEQIAAGELPAGSRFPIPQLTTTPTTEETKDTFDPCPPGYQLVDGVCQPDTMFEKGGKGDGRPEFPSQYYGDIYLPMAGGMATADPNVPYGEYKPAMTDTELGRLAAQPEYRPTLGTSLADLGRKFYQNFLFGIPYSLFPYAPTEEVTPRFTGGGFNPLALAPTPVPGAYQEAVAPEQLAALDITNPLIRAGASQPAVESVTRAMTNQAIQAAAQERFKEAQTEAAKKEGKKQKDRMVTAAVGKSYTGGPTVRGTTGMLGGGV